MRENQLSRHVLLQILGSRWHPNSAQLCSKRINFITFFLTHIIPLFSQAIMDSDLVQIPELVGVGHDLLQAIEILANVEEGAHDRLNAEVNKEIAKLDKLDVHA